MAWQGWFTGGNEWDALKKGAGWAKDKLFGTGELTAQDAERQKNLNAQAGAAGSFADQGEQGFGQLGADAQQRMDYLRKIASGQQSISAEQLRQGLQQNQAAQRSMAASASPYAGPMAARTAAIQSARLGSGMSGQAALAGLQERRDAESALAQMTEQLRQQNLQAALGSRQNAMTGYGAGWGNYQQDPGFIGKYGQMIVGAMGGGKKMG